MLDLRMQTFLTLCETLHYTHAAERLHVTQPTVTQHIQYLERYYGCALVRYEGKNVVLTEKGAWLRDYARAQSANEIRALAYLQREASEEVHLRMGATKTIGNYVLPSVFARLLNSRPQYQLSLTVDNTLSLLRQITCGEIDVALVEGTFDKSRYAHQLYRKEPFLAVSSKRYSAPVEFCDLLENRLILREEGSGTRQIAEELLFAHNYTTDSFAACTVISNFSVILELVKSGYGITFLYRAAVQSALDAGALFEIPIRDCHIEREFNYVSSKDCIFHEQIQSLIQETQAL